MEGFLSDLEERRLLPIYELRPCVYVESVETDGDRATVELLVQYYDPCLRGGFDFRNLSFNQTRLELERVGNPCGSGWTTGRPTTMAASHLKAEQEANCHGY